MLLLTMKKWSGPGRDAGMFMQVDSSERVEAIASTLTLTKTLKRIKQYQLAYTAYTGYSHAIEYRLLSVCEIEPLSTEAMYGAGIIDVEDMSQTKEEFHADD